MNIVRIRRIAIHTFFSIALFVAFTTPVFAIGMDLSGSNQINTIALNSQVPFVTPKHSEANQDLMGPFKPQDLQKDTKSSPPTPTQAPTKTPTKLPAPTITPTPTTIPTSTPTPKSEITPVQTGSNTSNGGLNADILFDMSNSYRSSKGLSVFQKDERICTLAAKRAPEISAEIKGGFMHAGKDSHGFPFWFTENIIEFRTESEAFNWWINDYIHRVQIEADNTNSCVACSGNACVQLFTSFVAK